MVELKNVSAKQIYPYEEWPINISLLSATWVERHLQDFPEDYRKIL